MRRETADWWAQAAEDLKTAELNIGIQRYYASVFFAQQAGEKALKALFIERKKRLPPRGHNMLDLTRALDAPKTVTEAAAELNPEYTVTRYPNAAKGIPEQMFNKRSAVTHLRAAKVIYQWVAKWLK